VSLAKKASAGVTMARCPTTQDQPQLATMVQTGRCPARQVHWVVAVPPPQQYVHSKSVLHGRSERGGAPEHFVGSNGWQPFGWQCHSSFAPTTGLGWHSHSSNVSANAVGSSTMQIVRLWELAVQAPYGRAASGSLHTVVSRGSLRSDPPASDEVGAAVPKSAVGSGRALGSALWLQAIAVTISER
jgi:hypothetical protein